MPPDPLVLTLEEEEALCLDSELRGKMTARVQVNLTFLDQHGKKYSASQIVIITLEPEE